MFDPTFHPPQPVFKVHFLIKYPFWARLRFSCKNATAMLSVFVRVSARNTLKRLTAFHNILCRQVLQKIRHVNFG